MTRHISPQQAVYLAQVDSHLITSAGWMRDGVPVECGPPETWDRFGLFWYGGSVRIPKADWLAIRPLLRGGGMSLFSLTLEGFELLDWMRNERS